MNNPMLKILVEDCGGHGRAIEVLSSLTENINMDECDIGNLMRDLCSRLVDIYWNVIDTNAAKAIVRGVFTNQQYDQKNPGRCWLLQLGSCTQSKKLPGPPVP
jgi:hypothetical protein